MKTKTVKVALCGLFTALIIVGAFLRIPIPVIPFTFQTLFVVLAGALLGSKGGAASTACYALMGLLGIPVFTQGGGFSYVLQPSFGYILGFIGGAFLTGLLIERAEKLTFWRALAAIFAGLAVIYLAGMIYGYILCNYVLGIALGFYALILHYFLMVIPGDICLCILAAVLTVKLRPVLKKIRSSRKVVGLQNKI